MDVFCLGFPSAAVQSRGSPSVEQELGVLDGLEGLINPKISGTAFICVFQGETLALAQ